MKKPFFEHLKELNRRVLFSVLLLISFSVIVYLNYSFFLDYLVKPLVDAGYSVDNIFAITNSINKNINGVKIIKK